MAELAQTEQRVLPAPAVEAASKVYLEDLAKGIGAARTVDLSKIYGPSFVAPESQFTQQARAATFQCLDGPSLYCRAEPASPHIQLRVFGHKPPSSVPLENA